MGSRYWAGSAWFHFTAVATLLGRTRLKVSNASQLSILPSAALAGVLAPETAERQVGKRSAKVGTIVPMAPTTGAHFAAFEAVVLSGF